MSRPRPEVPTPRRDWDAMSVTGGSVATPKLKTQTIACSSNEARRCRARLWSHAAQARFFASDASIERSPAEIIVASVGETKCPHRSIGGGANDVRGGGLA